MCVVDFDALCDRLDISVDDLYSGQKLLDKMFQYDMEESGIERKKPFIDFANAATHGQLIAVIRCGNLHKRFPGIFTWDGLNESASEEDIKTFSMV